MAEDYVPFEEALKSLKISEEELRHLVSQDQIQALQAPDGSIQVRREDLEKLLSSEPEVLTEDLDFADDAGDGEEGMVTAVLEEDSLLEEEDTLDLSPDELVVEEAPEPTVTTPVRSRSRAAGLRDDTPDGQESTLDRVLVIASAVLLVYSLFFAYSIAQGQKTGLTAWLADMFKVQ